MEQFIEFLSNNYIWFLVITIVLLFSLIGYLVESSKYPKEPKEEKEKLPDSKELKPKKEKKKKKDKKKDDIIEDNTPTVEEAMKMEQEKVEELNPNPENSNNQDSGEYDKPLMADENNDEKL